MNRDGLEEYLLNIDIKECLNQLKDEDRQIIVLYYWWGYKDEEIGKMLNLSQQSVNYKRKKANSYLRDKLLGACI
jgi:RNA polymerase sigma factor (sigma-70 family)